MNKKNLVLGAVTLIAVCTLGLALWNSLATDVRVAKVRSGAAVDAVPGVVNVRSDYTMTLRSEEPGRVKNSSLKLGAKVQASELILNIDSTDLEIDAGILRSDIESLEKRLSLDTAEETNLQRRREDLENFRRQFAAGNYPKLEMERRERDFSVFEEAQELRRLNEEQQLTNLKNRLKKLERRLEKTKVYAPADGIITQIFAHPGELINSGSILATLSSEAIVVEARVNEENFAGIRTGLDATVRLLTYKNKLFDAKVVRILPTADRENQQYTVFLEVEISKEKLIPGLSGEASIIRRKIAESLVIPRRALIGDHVFKANGGRAVLTPVKVGVRGLNIVEIREGLSEGDTILTDGLTRLQDGDRIRITE